MGLRRYAGQSLLYYEPVHIPGCAYCCACDRKDAHTAQTPQYGLDSSIRTTFEGALKCSLTVLITLILT